MALEKQRVYIAIPIHSGEIRHETMQSVLAGFHALATVGIAPAVQILSGCSLIQDARDVLVGHFLKSDCTDLVWVDGDIQFAFQDLIRLVRHPVDVVAGVYRFKKDIEAYPIRLLDGEIWSRDPLTGQPSNDGLVKVGNVPMGFCRMKRSVLERMREARKEFEFTTHMFPGDTFWGMFDREVYDRQSWGEDYTFCKRWREIGGEVHIDPWITLSHIGTKAYSGCFADYLKNQAKPETAEQTVEKVRQLREAFSNPEFKRNMKIAIGE